MSKMDNLRAMREARYAEAQKRAAAAPRKAAARAPVAPPVEPDRKAEPLGATAGPATDDLCGHRNMSGRTCTRERGHAARTHRYS
jgi:hypothetical protein